MAISGYGSGQVTSLKTHGKSTTISGPLMGLDVPFGPFSGSATATLSTNKNATGSAILHAADGDTIRLTLSGPYRIPATLPTVVSGSVGFRITSVTGPHHGATGSGTIILAINTITGAGHVRLLRLGPSLSWNSAGSAPPGCLAVRPPDPAGRKPIRLLSSPSKTP